jgi:hypothetical protein
MTQDRGPLLLQWVSDLKIIFMNLQLNTVSLLEQKENPTTTTERSNTKTGNGDKAQHPHHIWD